MLLNGFLASIECEEFTNASYLNVSSRAFLQGNETYSELSICGLKVFLIASRVESKEGQKRWKMLSIFLRCLVVTNLLNTTEIQPIVEYLQVKKMI